MNRLSSLLRSVKLSLAVAILALSLGMASPAFAQCTTTCPGGVPASTRAGEAVTQVYSDSLDRGEELPPQATLIELFVILAIIEILIG